MDDIRALESELAGLVARSTPVARRRLAVTIARKLRTSQAARMRDQKNPDGSPYEPRASSAPAHREKRKPGPGRLRRMFEKLRTARFLKMQGTSDTASVFFHARVRRISWEHQMGGKARDGALMPRRTLLGLTAPECEAVSDTIIEHLARQD